jgi:hypothetical protein
MAGNEEVGVMRKIILIAAMLVSFPAYAETTPCPAADQVLAVMEQIWSVQRRFKEGSPEWQNFQQAVNMQSDLYKEMLSNCLQRSKR